MKHFLYIVVLLILASYQCYGLTQNEEGALSSLAEQWPSLRRLPVPWSTTGAAYACEQPVWSGLTCSPGPESHVIALYVLKKVRLRKNWYFSVLMVSTVP